MIAEENFNILKTCKYGFMLFNKNDSYVGKSYKNYGEWKEGELLLFNQIIHDGQVVLDVGANIGQHTLFFSQAVGITGKVHAFEPQRLFFQTLCSNMALNSIVNVFTYQSAVGATTGTIKVPVASPWQEEANFAALALRDYQSGEEVPLISIDSLKLSQCHFIKIEVVGMEREVLQGAGNTISQHQPFLYVENDSKGYVGKTPEGYVPKDNQAEANALIMLIDGMGYDMYWHEPPYYNPNNFFGNKTNVFRNDSAKNMLCVPRSKGYNLEGFEPVEVPA